ncbi:Disease resistance protein [Quillaja saponaria]|uniref:Disease resistance protein n=1 Tax=Quillaja saponaria TaxID=32244 RepID=A0AAD7PZJ2_QUISA|nr:Disease resistance protein [Quillaja saponaria]
MDFLIAIGTGFTSKVGESLVSPIARQFSYMFEYDKNISKLKEEHEKLKEKKYRVKGKVEADERNALQIPGHIKGWLTSMDQIDQEIEGFYKDEVNRGKRCLGGWCPNLKIQYSMSRKAVKKTEDILNIREEIKVDIMSYRPAPLPLSSIYATKDIMSFESRLSTMNEILKTLKDEKINIMSICGNGGVGKTTLAKEVIKIVEENKLCDEVAMAVVSQNPDIMKIQDQIADNLGLTFQEKTEQGRAGKLLQRLMQNKKFLIILDDIWSGFDFKSIGLPSGEQQKGCKILLTSRNEHVCGALGSQKNFIISDLLEREASDLFKMMAADTVDQPDIKQIAEQVVEECGPFPLAIVTVAKALKGKKLHSWEAALARLRKPSRTYFSKMQECIELSYNFLKNKEAKEFLLLSASLFPEDSDIPIEDLFRCGLGFGWFKDSVDVILDSRNEVHSLVDELKGCFLLLDSNKEGCIKMHDVVRDVAKSIASRPEHGFMISCDAKLMEWPHKDICHDSSVISLKFGKLKDHPGGLECPKLNLLHIAYDEDSALRDCNFFQGMTNLKVLSLQNSEILSDFQPLQNLHTLRLERCRLKDISAIVIPLKKLEILSLFRSEIDGVPESVGQLSNLKLLDLTNCRVKKEETFNGVFTAPPPSFLQLQELYMRTEDIQWIIDYDMLRSVSRQLKALELILKTDRMPKDLEFENLVKFFIYLGNRSSFEFAYFILKCFGGFDRSGGFTGPNYLAIEAADYKYIKDSFSIQQLIRKSDVLMLVMVVNLRNCVHELDGDGFTNLQDLTIKKCSDLECLVDESETIDSQCFGRLRSLEVYDCEKLKSFFPSFVAFEKIGFSNLVELTLRRLPCLIGLVHARGESRQSFTKVSTPCQMVEQMATQDQSSTFKSIDARQISANLFTYTWMQQFSKLEKIILSNCSSLEVIFDLEGSHFGGYQTFLPLFPQLKQLVISYLNELACVWSNVPHNNIQGFCNLTSINLCDCHSIRYLCTLRIAKLLTQLKSFKLGSCKKIGTIVAGDQVFHLDNELNKMEMGIVDLFPKLDYFCLWDLPELVNLCPSNCNLTWPSVTRMFVEDCPKLKTCSSIVQSNNLKPMNDVPHDSTLHRHGAGVDTSTSSKQDSHGFLRDCFGCVPFNAFLELPMKSNEAILMTENSLSVTKIDKYHSLDLEVIFPNLEELKIDRCHSMDVILEVQENRGDCDVALNCFIKFELWRLHREPQEVIGFHNLTLLEVNGCKRLRYLFSSFVPKLVKNLRTLDVSECDVLVEVVKKEVDISSHSTFSQLQAYAPRWPSLKNIRIRDCHKLKAFDSEIPILFSFSPSPVIETTKIETSNHQYQFPNKQVALNENKSVVAANVDSITYYQGETLPRVEELRIINCDSLEVVFQLENINDSNPLFNSIREMYFRALTNLKHIWKMGRQPVIGFQSLEKLDVWGCNVLTYIMLPSVANLLTNLKKLDVGECNALKTVIANGEENTNKTYFPKIKHIELWELPELESFSNQSCSLEWPPSTVKFNVSGCPKFKKKDYVHQR